MCCLSDQEDPFKGRDPFANFADASSSDPFQSQDPFKDGKQYVMDYNTPLAQFHRAASFILCELRDFPIHNAANRKAHKKACETSGSYL